MYPNVCKACGTRVDEKTYWLVIFGDKKPIVENGTALCGMKCYQDYKKVYEEEQKQDSPI
jgi:hypothetical protein